MPSGEEQVLAVIPHAELSAGTLAGQTRTQTLVLTDQHVIVARFTSSIAKELGRSADTKRPARLGATSDTASLVVDKYLAMTPQDILTEHKSNFAIARSEIRKVKLKYTGGLGSGTVAELLTIKTDEQTYKLALPSSKQARKALAKADLLPASS